MITKYDVLRKPLITEKVMFLQERAQGNTGFKKEFDAKAKEAYEAEIKSGKRKPLRKGLKEKSFMKKTREDRPFSVVVFKVHPDATKTQIKEAVQEFFNVKVKSVRTMNFKGKEKRFGRTLGRRNDWKKAVVTLQDGEKLEFI